MNYCELRVRETPMTKQRTEGIKMRRFLRRVIVSLNTN